MASINGLALKGVKRFVGHEGETLYQGSLYMNGRKIGSWSQDSHGGPDRFALDAGWERQKALDAAFKAMYPEKAIHGVAANGEPYVIEYGLEFAVWDILQLYNDEMQFREAVNHGYAGTLIVTDGQHMTTWHLTAAYAKLSDDALFEYMKDDIAKVKESFFPEDDYTKHSVKVYRSLNDFVIGEPLHLKVRSVDALIADSSERSKLTENRNKANVDIEKE